MPFSPATLLASLERHLPAGASGALCVGFSGGLDSSALLHALAIALRDHPRYHVRAIHIDHQLHPSSAQWQADCEQVARAVGVACFTRQVSVPLDSGAGTEASARTVRYAAFRELLQDGEALLTAHHADDQLETLLLALVRGAGVHGLAGMPACHAFGRGWHLRPLLDVPRAEIESWARQVGLRWLDDPSNRHTGFSRNYLRHEVIPLLRKRWPAITPTAARAAQHLGEAAELLDAIAAADLAAASVGQCLSVAALRVLDPPRRSNLLRHWLRKCGARSPSTRKLAGLEYDMLAAQNDRLPVVAWDDFEVRRYRELLYAGPASCAAPGERTLDWDWRSSLQLGEGLGLLRTEIVRGQGLARAKLPPSLYVGFRRGGEELQLPGHARHRDLKKLLQEADILPWWRQRIPLIHVREELVAVADLWIAHEFAAHSDEEGVRIFWEGHPQIAATR